MTFHFYFFFLFKRSIENKKEKKSLVRYLITTLNTDEISKHSKNGESTRLVKKMYKINI